MYGRDMWGVILGYHNAWRENGLWKGGRRLVTLRGAVSCSWTGSTSNVERSSGVSRPEID